MRSASEITSQKAKFFLKQVCQPATHHKVKDSTTEKSEVVQTKKANDESVWVGSDVVKVLPND